MFYTYVLQSQKTNQLYIGQTNNPSDRLSRHNSNRNKWTKNKGPWKYIYLKSFESRSEAMGFEKKLKDNKAKKGVDTPLNEPGNFMTDGKKYLRFFTLDGFIEVEELQLQGKNRNPKKMRIK